jgi:hypothetical protein
MKNLKPLISTIVIALLVAGPLNAQTPRRIQFQKGKSSTVVKGVSGSSGVTYVLRARSGQKIVLDLSPKKGVGIKVETNGRYGQMVLLREEIGGHYEVGLEETGDYTIFIGSTSGTSVPFILKVGVTRLSDI